jgi:hypothetical protein
MITGAPADIIPTVVALFGLISAEAFATATLVSRRVENTGGVYLLAAGMLVLMLLWISPAIRGHALG